MPEGQNYYITKAQLLRLAGALSKPVLCIESNQAFPSIRSAAQHFGVRKRAIRRAINSGGRCAMHTFRYFTEEGGK